MVMYSLSEGAAALVEAVLEQEAVRKP
jgi:hypothetical protein